MREKWPDPTKNASKKTAEKRTKWITTQAVHFLNYKSSVFICVSFILLHSEEHSYFMVELLLNLHYATENVSLPPKILLFCIRDCFQKILFSLKPDILLKQSHK